MAKNEYHDIKKILDNALLDEKPMQKFKEAIPIISKFSVVDSVWVDGYTLFVKYKKGGVITWMISPSESEENNIKK